MSTTFGDPNARRELPRVLGPFDALAVVVGSIIGSGIFLKPSVIARDLGDVGLILSVWLIAGLVTLFGALTVAELSAMLPQAGGPYVYLREAYGRLPAFLLGWTEFWVVRTGSLGALATATAVYLREFLPLLSVNQEEWVAIGLVVALSVVNVLSTRWGARVQNITVLVKVGFLLFLIVLPFLMWKADASLLGNVFSGDRPWTSKKLWLALGSALIAVWWAYDGWINLGPVAEEVRDPQRNVPFALGLGMAIVIFVYVLVNVAYHVTLPVAVMAKTDRVAATMCGALIGPYGAMIVAVGVMFSTFGAVNSNLLVGPRIYFAMARDGLLPKAIAAVHRTFLTPANAVVLQAVWSVLLIVAAYAWAQRPGSKYSAADAFELLTNFVVFGGSIFYSMAVAAVFVLRRTRPDLPRPYRTWGYPVVPAIYLVAFAALLVSLLASKPAESIAGCSLIAIGFVVYYWAKILYYYSAKGRSG